MNEQEIALRKQEILDALHAYDATLAGKPTEDKRTLHRAAYAHASLCRHLENMTEDNERLRAIVGRKYNIHDVELARAFMNIVRGVRAFLHCFQRKGTVPIANEET